MPGRTDGLDGLHEEHRVLLRGKAPGSRDHERLSRLRSAPGTPVRVRDVGHVHRVRRDGPPVRHVVLGLGAARQHVRACRERTLQDPVAQPGEAGAVQAGEGPRVRRVHLLDPGQRDVQVLVARELPQGTVQRGRHGARAASSRALLPRCCEPRGNPVLARRREVRVRKQVPVALGARGGRRGRVQRRERVVAAARQVAHGQAGVDPRVARVGVDHVRLDLADGPARGLDVRQVPPGQRAHRGEVAVPLRLEVHGLGPQVAQQVVLALRRGAGVVAHRGRHAAAEGLDHVEHHGVAAPRPGDVPWRRSGRHGRRRRRGARRRAVTR